MNLNVASTAPQPADGPIITQAFLRAGELLGLTQKELADIIGMSALLTTTMTYMKTVIDGFRAAGRGDIKMAVGGAPISEMFAEEIGADGYGANASAAVDLFLRLAAERRDGNGELQDSVLAGSTGANQS